MKALQKAVHVIDLLSDWSGKIVSIGMVLIIFPIVYDVVARYVFHSPTIWAAEGSTLLFGVCWLIGGAYVLYHGRHVKMEILYERLSRRKQALLDVLTAPLFFVFMGVFVWQGIRMAALSLSSLENSSSLWGPPLYPVKMAIPIGGVLLLLAGFSKFIRDLAVALGRDKWM